MLCRRGRLGGNVGAEDLGVRPAQVVSVQQRRIDKLPARHARRAEPQSVGGIGRRGPRQLNRRPRRLKQPGRFFVANGGVRRMRLDGGQLSRSRQQLLCRASLSIVMLFVSFTTLFVARREAGKFDPLTGGFQSDWIPVSLPMKILLINSAVLIVGCLFVEIAKRAARLDSILVPMSHIPGIRPIRQSSPAWVWAAAAAGFGFLFGQYVAWRRVHLQVGLLNNGPAGTFFILFTGVHAVHLAAGLVVLLYACLASGPRRSLERRRIILDVTALYWHFIAVMWVYVLVVLRLMD